MQRHHLLGLVGGALLLVGVFLPAIDSVDGRESLIAAAPHAGWPAAMLGFGALILSACRQTTVLPLFGIISAIGLGTVVYLLRRFAPQFSVSLLPLGWCTMFCGAVLILVADFTEPATAAPDRGFPVN